MIDSGNFEEEVAKWEQMTMRELLEYSRTILRRYPPGRVRKAVIIGLMRIWYKQQHDMLSPELVGEQ